VAADNELGECSKKKKKNKNNKKRERSTEGGKENCEKNKSNQKLEPVVEGYRSGDLRQEKVIITITFYAVQENWKQNKTPHVDKDSSIACADVFITQTFQLLVEQTIVYIVHSLHYNSIYALLTNKCTQLSVNLDQHF